MLREQCQRRLMKPFTVLFVVHLQLEFTVSSLVRQSYENSHTRFQETGKAKDPYTVLNVDRDASPEEIKNSYKKLANKYHPDKVLHLGEEFKKMAEERFKEIQEAYRELIPK